MPFHWKRNKRSHVFVVQQHDVFGYARTAGDKTIDTSSDFYISSDLKAHERAISSTLSPGRQTAGFAVFFIVLGLFFIRAAYLQVWNGQAYHARADANRYRVTRVISPRGKIIDRNGQLLATNTPSFVLTMRIADLPKDLDERQKEVRKLAGRVGLQPADLDLLIAQYTKQPQEQIPVLRDIPYESAIRLTIELSQFPGFTILPTVQRTYPAGVSSLSHVLGYTGKIAPEQLAALADEGYKAVDQIGKTGVEQTAELTLRGTPGFVTTEVDASGHELSVISKTDPVPGEMIRLHIDLDFQKFIEVQTQSILQHVNARRASIVAIDPTTGDVRALVSLPAFDNNLFSGQVKTADYQSLAEDPDQPLFFRALSGEYPSGSIFKPIVAYAALAEHIVDSKTSFISSGGIRVGDWFFPDWKGGGHGVTDVRKAIAESVNTYFYIIGGGFQNTTGLGVDRIVQYAKKFGFGEKTGIDLPNEADGFLPSKEWKERVKGERWYVGDTYHLAIGQGDFLTTPLQMAQAIAAIANGGILYTPKVINDGKVPEGRPIEALDAAALQVVQEGMRQSVLAGSNRRLQSLSFPVAGKTGTAQSSKTSPTHSWFAGYGPYQDPTLALIVLVEAGGESTAAAVPLAEQIFSYWFSHGNR